MTDIKSLGPRIREARNAAGISIFDMANAVGATVEQQERIESGKVDVPYTLVLRAAVVLETEPSTWLSDVEVDDDLVASLFDHADDHYKVIQGLRPSQQRRTHGQG